MLKNIFIIIMLLFGQFYYYIYLLNEQKININCCYCIGYRVVRKWYLKLFIQTDELKNYGLGGKSFLFTNWYPLITASLLEIPIYHLDKFL